MVPGGFLASWFFGERGASVLTFPRGNEECPRFRSHTGVQSETAVDALVYANIRAANPNFAVQILVTLAQYIEKTKITRIDDKEFKLLLKEIAPKKRDFKIKRK